MRKCEKVNTNKKIGLVDNSNIISSETEIAEKLNICFSKLSKSLTSKLQQIC